METYDSTYLTELGSNALDKSQRELLHGFLDWLEAKGMIDWRGKQARPAGSKGDAD